MIDFRSRLAKTKSKLPEKALALPDSQRHSPLIGDKPGQLPAIPRITAEAEIGWFHPQSTTNLFQLLIAKSSRPARFFPIRQSGEAFLFEPVNPIRNSPGRISQEHGNLCATQPPRNQQHTVQPMVVTRLIGSANLIPQGQNDFLGFGDMDSFHSGVTMAPSH